MSPAHTRLTPKEQIERLRALEFATTMRVLRAFPEEQLEMRPAPKSRSARQLITTLITEEHVCRAALRGENPYGSIPTSWPASLAELLSAYDRIHAESQHLFYVSGDPELDAPLDLNGLKVSALEVLWIELLDQIHHRGQFSVYLRLVDARVPSIYGPTADETPSNSSLENNLPVLGSIYPARR